MIRHGRTKMLISPLIFKIQRHVTYQRIALCDIHPLIKSIILYYNAHEKDRKLLRITIIIFQMAISQLILLQSVPDFLYIFLIIPLREACSKILIKILVQSLCYVEIFGKYFVTIIYVLCHTN